MAGTKAISADSHVQEAPELFETRVPEEFRARLPHTEEGEDGAVYRVVEGRKKRRFDIAAENINEDDLEREFRQDPSGGRDIPYRLKDQDRDGVVAEVLYPNSLLALYASPDPKYQMAVARAYNDWAIELFREPPGQVCARGARAGGRRRSGGGGSKAGLGAGVQADKRSDTSEAPALQPAHVRAALERTGGNGVADKPSFHLGQ